MWTWIKRYFNDRCTKCGTKILDHWGRSSCPKCDFDSDFYVKLFEKTNAANK